MKYLTGLFFTSSLWLALAQQAHTSDIDEFFPELPTVVSANRLNQTILKSPASVSIIDADMIKAAGIVELVDIFRLVPGFQVAHVNGRKYTISYHGGGWENGNWMQVLVNGRSTYLSALSVVDWDTIGVHIEDIEKIEIIRSPSASAYGSNSFSAAINIITKPINSSPKFTLKTRFGSDNESYQYLHYSGLLSSHEFRASMSSRKNNGLDSQEDSRDLQNFNVDTFSNLSTTDTLETHFHLADGDTSASESEFVDSRKRLLDIFSGHVKWRRAFSSDLSWTLAAYHSQREEDDLINTPNMSEIFDVPPEQIELLTGSPNQSVPVGIETFKLKQSDIDMQINGFGLYNIQYALSLGYKYDYFQSVFYLNTKNAIDEETLRGTANIAIPILSNLTLNSGLLIEKNPDYSTQYSPRASLNFEPTENQSLRLSASTAKRIPSLLERYMDSKAVMDNGFLINDIYDNDPALEPATIKSYELSYSGNLYSLPLSWQVSAYKDTIENYIWFVKVQGISDLIDQVTRVPMNAGKYKTDGVEGELTYRPTKGTFYKVFFNTGDDEDRHFWKENPRAYNSTNTKIPTTSWGGLASWQIKNWQFSTAIYDIGKMEWASSGTKVEEYFRVDAKLNYTTTLPSIDSELDISLTAQNFNGDYEEFDNDITIEPRYFLAIQLTGM